MLGQLFVTTVQQPVTVALAAILFDGEVQIGWRWFRGAAREVPRTVRPAEPRPYRAAGSPAAGPAVANLAVPTDPTRLPA